MYHVGCRRTAKVTECYMSPPNQGQPTAKRQCVYCGKLVPSHLTHCSFCRELLPQIRVDRPTGPGGGREIRRGLLYMLLAALIYYFAGGYSPMNLPFPISPVVTMYLLPLLFFGGLGLSLYGFYLRIRT